MRASIWQLLRRLVTRVAWVGLPCYHKTSTVWDDTL